MFRIWPDPDPRALDDEALTGLYRPAAGVPSVRMNFVTSVDGAVELDGHSAGLQSGADQRVFQLLRMFPHGLLIGAGTLRHEGYGPVRLDPARRDWRTAHGLDAYPRLIVVSARLDLDPTHPALAGAPVRPIVLTHAQAPPDRRTALAAVADVREFGDDVVDLRSGLAALRAEGIGQVLSEGGPHLFGALTAADLVDEVCLTIAPMLAGAGAGRITAGPGAVEPRGLALAHALTEDGNLLLRYARAA